MPDTLEKKCLCSPFEIRAYGVCGSCPKAKLNYALIELEDNLGGFVYVNTNSSKYAIGGDKK